MGGYIPHTDRDREEMLRTIGTKSIEDLFADIPVEVHLNDIPVGLPSALSEPEVTQLLRTLAQKNANLAEMPSFLGAGVYRHFIPSAVRSLVQRSEFATAYTPYQPEVSQGSLQAIYEYQSMICALTALPVSNASLYDGATALVEAVALACRVTKRSRVIVSQAVSPFTRQVLQTYARGADWEIVEVPFDSTRGTIDLDALRQALGQPTACVAIQHPNFFGILEPVNDVKDSISTSGALFIASVDPISLGILAPPGEYGADIAVGNGQSLGNTLNFGGPTFGFFATKKEYARQVPGRIAGRTVDQSGQTGYVLALQTREQHIRREKATSNICTNEALNALAGSIYLALMGPEGLKRAALLTLERAEQLKEATLGIPGVRLAFQGPTFKEFAVILPKDPNEVNAELLKQNIIGGYAATRHFPSIPNLWLLSATESTTTEQIGLLAKHFRSP